ncbi:MAG: hypothetical protein PF448_04790 [Bacteroidales bacterium]|jgi:hypothetical protein|nr:hypothetical protein [Bacteroidales bacterium]
MTQEAIIKSLEQFAVQRNLPFFSSSEKQYNIPNRPIRYVASRYVIYDLSKVHQGLYFIFHDPSTGGTYANSGWGSAYCGIYKTIDDFSFDSFTIRARERMDKFSFKRRYQTGDPYLDKKLSIYTKARRIDLTFHSEKKMYQLLQIMQTLPTLQVKTEVDAWNIVPALDHQNLISLKVNNWLVDYAVIEKFILNACEYLLKP